MPVSHIDVIKANFAAISYTIQIHLSQLTNCNTSHIFAGFHKTEALKFLNFVKKVCSTIDTDWKQIVQKLKQLVSGFLSTR